MPKSSAELDRDIAEVLASRRRHATIRVTPSEQAAALAVTRKPVCHGIDTDGLTTVPLTEAKRRSSAEFERCYLSSVMERAGGSVSEGARVAGLDRTNFRRLLHRYGIR